MAAKRRRKGVEAQLSWRPVHGLQLLANGAWTDAKLDEDAPDAGGFKGDWLPWVPRTSFSLNADYDWPLSTHVDAYVGAGWHYVGRQYADFDVDYRAGNTVISAGSTLTAKSIFERASTIATSTWKLTCRTSPIRMV